MGATLTLEGVRRLRAGADVLSVGELRIARGERVGVLGANGAGKTTLLRILAGLDRPDAGAVLLDGAALSRDTRRRIAFAAQRPALLTMSVARNVELPLRYRGVARAERRHRAQAALERLGAAHLARRPAHALSGGEAQRVSLARALVTDPAVLLLDEPAAALDAGGRRSFVDDLERALSASQATVVHVSHRAEELLRASARLLVLAGGRVVQAGAPSSVLAAPVAPEVARLLGYDNVVRARVAGGNVLLAGHPCGLAAPGAADGDAALAVWASGIRLAPAGVPGIPAVVGAAVEARGHREITVHLGSAQLRALASLAAPAPRRGAPVAVTVDAAHAALVPIGPTPLYSRRVIPIRGQEERAL